jgi:hypothetical protein
LIDAVPLALGSPVGTSASPFRRVMSFTQVPAEDPVDCDELAPCSVPL